MRIILLFTVLAVLTGCASTKPAVDGKKQTAEQRANQVLVYQFRKALNDLELEKESASPWVKLEQGKLWYQIALYDHDYAAVQQSIDILADVIKEPKIIRTPYRHSDALVHLGSAYSLRARDYPGSNLVKNFTPVGFVRIKYVRKGVAYMDKAVEVDPDNPIVRLVRGLSGAMMPAPFGQRKKGLSDLKLLISWIEQPDQNKTYETILRDHFFLQSAYLNTADVMHARGNKDKAAEYYRRAIKQNKKSNMAYLATSRLKAMQSDSQE